MHLLLQEGLLNDQGATSKEKMRDHKNVDYSFSNRACKTRVTNGRSNGPTNRQTQKLETRSTRLKIKEPQKLHSQSLK